MPVPCAGSVAELNALPHAGRDRLNEEGRARDGRATGAALAEDAASMHVLPGAPFDAVRWASARADKRGTVTVDGRGYLAGPAWHSRELVVGLRADAVEILADRGRRVAMLPRAYGEGPTVRDPLSLVPALVARPRAFGESVIRRDMPAGLVRARWLLEELHLRVAVPSPYCPIGLCRRARRGAKGPRRGTHPGRRHRRRAGTKNRRGRTGLRGRGRPHGLRRLPEGR